MQTDKDEEEQMILVKSCSLCALREEECAQWSGISVYSFFMSYRKQE